MRYAARAVRYTQSALWVKRVKKIFFFFLHFYAFKSILSRLRRPFYFSKIFVSAKCAWAKWARCEREYATPDCDTSNSDLLVRIYKKLNWMLVPEKKICKIKLDFVDWSAFYECFLVCFWKFLLHLFYYNWFQTWKVVRQREGENRPRS